jgi:hypothetical protein
MCKWVIVLGFYTESTYDAGYNVISVGSLLHPEVQLTIASAPTEQMHWPRPLRVRAYVFTAGAQTKKGQRLISKESRRWPRALSRRY